LPSRPSSISATASCAATRSTVDDGSIDFDVVTELVFADRDGYRAWAGAVFRPGAAEQVIADEERFLDRARTRAFVVEEFVTAERPPRPATSPEPTR
jgi:EthD domain